MASSWGGSWGTSWLNSWGPIADPVVPTPAGFVYVVPKRGMSIMDMVTICIGAQQTGVTLAHAPRAETGE